MKKISVSLHGHRTSISLEEEFWSELQAIAAKKKLPLQQLISEIDDTRKGNLSSAIRLYVLQHLKNTH